MKTMIFEGIQEHGKPQNWGKFMVGILDAEWFRDTQVEPGSQVPLLERIGWTQQHIWVMDLATGEGAWFRHGGNARADLERHRIWVCPLFEEFLAWLYKQDLNRLHQQPGVIELPDAMFSINGYRRPGPHDVSFTLRKGDLMQIEWAGETRTVVCDGFDESGDAVIRSLSDDELYALGKHTEAGIEARQEPDITAELEQAWLEGVPAEHPYPDGSFSNAEAHREALAARLARPDLDETLSIDPVPDDTQA